MPYNFSTHSIIYKIMAIVSILFGIVTIKSGGMVLFTTGDAHQAAGHYVPFVLWFNFIAGFAYIAAGTGLWSQQSWAALLAKIIALSTLFIFIILGIYIYTGGSYEVRTLGAMTMRSAVWCSIALTTVFMTRNKPSPTDK